MNRPLHLTVAACSLLFCQTISHPAIPAHIRNNSNPKIQMALLLDVSNSMDGLITQAKEELWKMVKLMGRIQCNDKAPSLEIALYEYGRETNDSAKGYIKQIAPFINDLDKLYNSLYSLTTDGGKEFCGYVIKTSLEELDWETSASNYKVIFIAGNESFLQGPVGFAEACVKANQIGIIVNTIYCGFKERGIKENWDLGAECGNGSFTAIDQDAKPLNIPTPYDTMLIVLNEKLNSTFIRYGKIPEYDTVPTYDIKSIDKVVNYIVVKADKNLYNRSAWDLGDAVEKDSTLIDKIDMGILDDSLKNKSRNYLKQLVQSRLIERKYIRTEIKKTDAQRDLFLQDFKLKTGFPETLGSEIEKIIRTQIIRFNMKIV